MARKIGCIQKRGKRYTLFYRNEYLGTYDTYEEAEQERQKLIKVHEPVEISEYLPVFAERLNIAIGKTNRSVADISRQAKMSQTCIPKYLKGDTPNVKCLMSLALVLNVSTDWLLGLER